jgi:hypothetical protein
MNANLIQSILNRSGNDAITSIKQRLRSTGANATGKTAASLESVVTTDRLVITGGKGFGTNQRDGLPFAEAGRGLGKRPPYNDIRDWMIARGIISGESKKDVQLIKFFQYRIATKGTRLWRDKQHRDIVTSVIDADFINRVFNDASDVFANSVETEVLKAFKK